MSWRLAFLEERPPTHLETPPHLRAPELLLGGCQLGHWVDMWSFGCLIYELLTGSPLFYVERMEGSEWEEQAKDKHLIQITEVLQPLPNKLLSKWRRVGSYYTTQGDRLDTDSDDETTETSSPLASSERYHPLEVKFMEKRPADMDDKEVAEVSRIIRMVLRPDPSERVSAAQLLNEAWFKG
jgi:serine/threonine protein kinase